MRRFSTFHGPMTPDGAPAVATRHLCHGGIFGGGGGGGGGGFQMMPPSPPTPPAPPILMLPPLPTPPVAPPDPPKPLAMPLADPIAQKNAEIKKLAQARTRVTSRANTIIGSDDTLGAG